MTIETLLEQMSRAEQVAALQLIWVRLTNSPEGIEPPDWHCDKLAGRRAFVDNGTARFSAWSEAQKTALRSSRVIIRILDEAEH